MTLWLGRLAGFGWGRTAKGCLANGWGFYYCNLYKVGRDNLIGRKETGKGETNKEEIIQQKKLASFFSLNQCNVNF